MDVVRRAPNDRASIGGVEYMVLGSLRAVQGGVARALGGHRQRMVLAVLLANVNRVVSQDALIEGVWSGEPPDAAKATVQSYVSLLRKELGGEILREGDGYRVVVAADQLDASRFERLVAEGRAKLDTDPAGALIVLQEALALWSGLPYGDLGGESALTAEVVRLEESRLSAVEYRVEADVAVGNHAEVIGELETLIRDNPFRERLRALQMLALYRSGRQAEALRAYQRVRALLGEELGIEPSTQLRDLEQQILEQDPALNLPTGPVVEPPAFLFTDVEDSALLWELHPRLVQQSLGQYDRILTQGVEEAGGRVFKHTGDGICAVFPEVGGAVAAALATQSDLVLAEWGHAPPLKVRMAIDIGEVEAKGADFMGPPLNRCARLLAAGHGGQVLVSADAEAALSEAPGSGRQVRALGEYRMRGLGRPQQVFQLTVEGLPSDFPPLVIDRLPPPIGSVRAVRGYELREQVVEGDFGVVYRAYQPSVGREVAVKVIRPEFVNRPDFVRRFEAEAQLIAQLEHPHIVQLTL